MTTKEPDYEIDVEYLGTTYIVWANVYNHGTYQKYTNPEEYDIIEDPEFFEYVITDEETGLEVIPEEVEAVKIIAENVLRNVYWQRELNI